MVGTCDGNVHKEFNEVQVPCNEQGDHYNDSRVIYNGESVPYIEVNVPFTFEGV